VKVLEVDAARKRIALTMRLGARSFEQAAGFLRVGASAGVQTDPLDASAVHPESYPLVERILADLGRGITEVVGNGALLRSLDPRRYADERFGVPTVRDILLELEKPGRDPRPEFKAASFREGVEGLGDLEAGMLLEGVVTNVTNFGAFVDIGVHQDGLVHVSAMSERFIKDPRTLVKTGELVKVKVLEVDAARKRIALTMRLGDAPGARAPAAPARPKPAGRPQRHAPAPAAGAMALAFAKLQR